jgi:hypothetical protein
LATPAIEFIAGSQTSLPLLKSVTGKITTKTFPVNRLSKHDRKTLGQH